MEDPVIEIQFLKMTGAGNDFILIDARDGQYVVDWSIFAPIACYRRYGIGADGLLIIEKSTQADFTMRYYNADGSYGGMCGNGGRCAARYVMSRDRRSAVAFEALDYIYHASIEGDAIRLEMKNPQNIQLKKLCPLDGSTIPYHFIDTGAPHVVLIMDEVPEKIREYLKKNGIELIGRDIRNHDLFAPAGANVNFVETDMLPILNMRTYERGVEAETLACGTGSVACAIIGALDLGIEPPVMIRTIGDETLEIDFKRELDQITDVTLTGPAQIVFSGTVYYDPEFDTLTYYLSE